MLHELIDREEPRCLYCNSYTDINFVSERPPRTSLVLEKEELTCSKCGEFFIIHYIQNSLAETEYDGFTFTCNDYSVYYNYIESYFDISDLNKKHITAIPAFEVNFSDKEKLYNKLKTYLIFS